MVIKVDKHEVQEEIGYSTKYPKWAIAYKFTSEQVETTLNGITNQVGRLGTITPVAELDPVLLMGSVIKRATLHNFIHLSKIDVRIGDKVIIEKAGDIVPQVVSISRYNKRADGVLKITEPEKCPFCDSKVGFVTGDKILSCLNHTSCNCHFGRFCTRF